MSLTFRKLPPVSKRDRETVFIYYDGAGPPLPFLIPFLLLSGSSRCFAFATGHYFSYLGTVQVAVLSFGFLVPP